MAIAVLYPRYHHAAIEERYASWQTQMLLKAGQEVTRLVFYERDEEARDVVGDVDEEHVLVITDPLLLASPRLGTRLRAALEASSAFAALPVSNEGAHPKQRVPPPAPYLTLRELQDAIETKGEEPPAHELVTWDRSDPAAYVCRTAALDDVRLPLRDALASRDVSISRTDFVHRWSSLRGQTRFDLLERISPDAKAVLEFGCGEAPLGQALKQRQKCRVVGIELDREAAAIAEKRIDAVYRGDVRDIVAILDERFDWIVGGDIVEHLEEPWSFLAMLRRLALPGAHLLLSIPNLSNASVVGDLLRGRFDYVYMGLTCVGHVRLFTKQTIADMLTIAGWTVLDIAPQNLGLTPQGAALIAALDAGGADYSREDLEPTGYYVVARND